jgi:hypothetical protein
MTLIEIEPGRFRFLRPSLPPARSDLPCPHIISDIMPETEQVDGRFYTSKRAFRAVGRALGLTEVGSEKFKPFVRSTAKPETKAARRDAVWKAFAQYKSGRRPLERR